MKTLKQLLEERAAKFAELKALNELGKNEKRELTDEETARFDELDGEIADLDEKLARAKRSEDLAAREAAAAATAPGAPGRDDAGGPPAEPIDHKALEAQRGLAFRGWLRGPRYARKEERQACEHMVLDFRSPEIRVNLVPDGLREAYAKEHESRVQHPDSGVAGGFLVAPVFVKRFNEALLAAGGLRAFAEVVVTENGAPMSWPGADDTGNTGELVAKGTTADSSSQDIAFSEQNWYAFQYGSKAVPVANSMLRDSGVDLEGIVAALLGKRLGRITGTHYATGTGAGQPEGIESGSVLGVTAASATAFTADELEDLIASVDIEYRSGAQFLVHDAVRSIIGKMKDGAGRYLFRGENESTENLIVHGYPVRVDQGLSAAPASGEQSVFFGQLAEVKIRDVGLMDFKRDESLYVLRNQVAFIGFMETDAKVANSGGDPIKHIVH